MCNLFSTEKESGIIAFCDQVDNDSEGQPQIGEGKPREAADRKLHLRSARWTFISR